MPQNVVSQSLPSNRVLTLVFAAVIAALVLLYFFISPTRRAQDQNNQLPLEYGLFHLDLNRQPGEPKDKPPSTEWLNMGYWKNEPVFPKACQALASKLISVLSTKPGSHVLGSEPVHLTGVTNVPSHCERARQRIHSRFPDLEKHVCLVTADAISNGSPDHPLSSSSTFQPFDAIMALDCAYHFTTRQKFLEQSFSRLNSGGRIALADICFNGASLTTLRTRVTTSLLRMMPLSNRISVDEYRQQMEATGYTDVSIEDITADVFPAFISFLKRQSLTWWLFGSVLQIYTSSGAQYLRASILLPHNLSQMTAIQAIFIRGYEERAHPKSHVVYKIEIEAHVRSWQMWRRYSEFDDLHTELTKSAQAAPPHPLPPKHVFTGLLKSKTDPKTLEERRAGLEAYLRAILGSKDERWRESFAFKEFLGIPTGRQAPAAADSNPFTSATWLDEHAALQTLLRDVWSDINKRDALSSQGDVAGSHKSNLAAKSKLAGVLSRIGGLGKSLRQLGLGGMAEGELQRRTDMVGRLQDDCERLGKVVSVARQTSSRGQAQSSNPLDRRPAPESDRRALLGGGTAAKPARRVFGASSSSPPKETAVTRPLDEVGLFQLQQQEMQVQDNQLSQLTTILQRQRQLGEAINHEVSQQIEMLDDLSNEVDRVGGKLSATNKKLNKLS
ncbi:hypothetical protein BKA70DRAFT_1395150 [Coprinopsis sp. MPI-PUGE-AT-0042]|nr:hypothetical protein BKA70DRAFT_1395150 [Coprinopsis sp. MPI-PUGE-AT-0042]